MYAIVKAGGKQHKVEANCIIKSELINAKVGDKIVLPCLMFVNGTTILAGEAASKVEVKAEVVEHGKDKKIVVFKYKAKKNERKKQGHRQPFTELKVLSIVSK